MFGLAVVAAWLVVQTPAGALSRHDAPATAPPTVAARTTNDLVLQDLRLRRPTGIAADPRVPGRLYTVDAGRRPLQVFTVDSRGRTVARHRLRGAKARQVTDIAVGRRGRLWIGDLGDPHRSRREVAVFGLRAPSGSGSATVRWSRTRLRYEDGRHDAKALLADPRSGRLFVVTTDGSRSAVYAAPRRLSSRVNVLRKVVSAPSGVTGGEFAASGHQLVLTHGHVVSVYRDFTHPVRDVTLGASYRPGFVAYARGAKVVLVGSRKPSAALRRVRLEQPTQATAVPANGSPLLDGLGWRAVQAPRPQSIMLMDRSLAPAAPAAPATLNPGPVMRVELRAGETVTTSGFVAHRAEVYGRNPTTTWSGTPSSKWPDPPGSTRWYDFSVFVPSDFPLASDARWFDLTQWKGYRGGSPPVALEIKRNDFRLGGANIARSLGGVARGGWTRLTVGLHFSTNRAEGWVQVYRNGKEVVARTPVATMDVVNGAADPVYLKQGIYRSQVWNCTHVLYFSPMRVSTENPIS